MKVFGKTKHHFMIEILNKPGEGDYLNIQKPIYEKPITNIIVNGENLKAFPARTGTRQGGSLSAFPLNIELELRPRT